MARRFLPLIAVTVVLIGLGNFLWLLADIKRAGGGADHPAPPYRVNLHGVYTEVDQQTWEWLDFHESTVLVTHVLAMGGGFYLVWRIFRFAEDGT